MLTIYAIIVAAIGLYAFLLSTMNIFAMKSYAPKKPEITTDGPMISVLIPARDEEQNLPATLEALLIQDYRNFEIIVCDDNSSDGTWEVVSRYMQMDSRVRGIQGKPLADGWRGKNYAVQQLIHAAHGEYVLITDADIHHSPDSLSYGYSALVKNKVDMISGYARETVRSMWTQTLISASLFITVLYVPLPLQRRRPRPAWAMAIGQYLFVRKAALDSIGGFASFRNIVTDDIELARTIVRNGFKMQFLDLNPILRVNMYDDFRSAFKGISRSVYHMAKSSMLPFFIVIVLLLYLLGLTPLVVLALSFPVYAHTVPILPYALLLGGTLLLYGSWIRSALFHNYRFSTALLGPSVFIIVGSTYIYGMYLKVSKRGMTWKGRPLN